MKKKVVSLLMVSAMLISVMSGCGSSAASQENGDMETSTEAGRESDSSDDSGTVSLTVWGAEEDQALLNEIVDSFKKEYGSQRSLTYSSGTRVSPTVKMPCSVIWKAARMSLPLLTIS